MWVMESIYPELALYGSKNERARTDTVFLPISEVCDGTVSLYTECDLAGIETNTLVKYKRLTAIRQAILGNNVKNIKKETTDNY